MGKGFDDDKSFDRAIIWDYKRKIACLVKRSVICNIELVNGSMGDHPYVLLALRICLIHKNHFKPANTGK